MDIVWLNTDVKCGYFRFLMYKIYWNVFWREPPLFIKIACQILLIFSRSHIFTRMSSPYDNKQQIFCADIEFNVLFADIDLNDLALQTSLFILGNNLYIFNFFPYILFKFNFKDRWIIKKTRTKIKDRNVNSRCHALYNQEIWVFIMLAVIEAFIKRCY